VVRVAGALVLLGLGVVLFVRGVVRVPCGEVLPVEGGEVLPVPATGGEVLPVLREVVAVLFGSCVESSSRVYAGGSVS
jgi:hypothetical protein